MTLPNDPLERWWVEVAAVNPDRVNAFRPSLVAFVAGGPSYDHHLIGTGFVIAGDPNFALVLTAKHVLVEGVARIQRPHRRHTPTTVLVSTSVEPSLDPRKLKVAWMGAEHADMTNVLHAAYNDTLDIALCIVMPQETSVGPFAPVTIPLDTGVPKVGDTVHMVSQDGMLLTELAPPSEASGKDQVLSLTKRVSIRIGVVTGVHLLGLRQYKWPCFTTSIPAEPGMSGGFVTVPRNGQTIAACGIVCADNSTTEARHNQLICGESVIACAWPALALRAPDTIPSEPNTPTIALYDLISMGRLDPPIGGLDCIRFVEGEHGDCSLERRDVALK